MGTKMDDKIIEKIRKRAHEIWEYRQEFQINVIVNKFGQYQNLTAQDDWLEAEREILNG
uniref:DUF2934 domain-containing protein n=1 Tax=viral metagenome TaxID=1070528 RepID=A0A6M3IVQ8_9ZZZZ